MISNYRARSSSRLNMTNKSSKPPTSSISNNSSPYHLQNNNKNGAKTGVTKRAKSADFTAKTNRTMSSLHNNTTNQQMSFDEFGANEDIDMNSRGVYFVSAYIVCVCVKCYCGPVYVM